MTFLVVKLHAPYNAILEWLGLCTLDVVVSIKYLMVKFPTDHWVGWLKGSQVVACQCYNAKLQVEAKPDPFPTKLDIGDEVSKEQGEPSGDLLEIPLLRGDPS